MSKILVTFYGGPLDGGTEAVESGKCIVHEVRMAIHARPRCHVYEYDKDSFTEDDCGWIHAKAIYAGVKE